MAIWQTLVSATEAGAVGGELIQAVREEAVSSTQVQCGVELVESVGCEGELIQADGDGVCSCLTGVRYLVVHKDENVRPDMHDRAVENALSSFPVLSQSDRITVLSLW
jgi:hypothetical protein